MLADNDALKSVAMPIDQAAKLVGVHRTTLLRAIQAGRLRGLKTARGWMVRRIDLADAFPLALFAKVPEPVPEPVAPPLSQLLRDAKGELAKVREELGAAYDKSMERYDCLLMARGALMALGANPTILKAIDSVLGCDYGSRGADNGRG